MSFEAVPRQTLGVIGSEIRYFPSLLSTNDYLLALSQASEGLIAVADEQTAGRGRGDHRWSSPAGENLTFSFLLTFRIGDPVLPLLPLLIALAVCETVESLGIEGIRTKWPNDVLFEERKLCGILIESRLRGNAARVVAGIGMNVNQRAFSPELASTATSLALILGTPVKRELLLGRLLDRLNPLCSERDHVAAVRRYAARCSTIGSRVSFDSPQGPRSGLAVGIDEHGRLLIDVQGARVAYAGSEVRQLRPAASSDEPADGNC